MSTKVFGVTATDDHLFSEYDSTATRLDGHFVA
jgi:hypothetical protein